MFIYLYTGEHQKEGTKTKGTPMSGCSYICTIVNASSPLLCFIQVIAVTTDSIISIMRLAQKTVCLNKEGVTEL